MTPGANAVSADLTGLQHSTTYHLRLFVENAGGSDSLKAADTFTTLPVVAPGITIDPSPSSLRPPNSRGKSIPAAPTRPSTVSGTSNARLNAQALTTPTI